MSDTTPELVDAMRRGSPYQGLELSSSAHLELVRVLGRMPYLPGTWGAGGTAQPKTVDELLATLDALADVLADVGARAASTELELSHLRHDVDAMRRLFAPAPAPKPAELRLVTEDGTELTSVRLDNLDLSAGDVATVVVRPS